MLDIWDSPEAIAADEERRVWGEKEERPVKVKMALIDADDQEVWPREDLDEYL